MLLGIGLVLFLGASFLLFCCVRVGAKADREMERIFKKSE